MMSYTFAMHWISEGELHSLKCGVTILFQERGLVCQVRDSQFNLLIPWDKFFFINPLKVNDFGLFYKL